MSSATMRLGLALLISLGLHLALGFVDEFGVASGDGKPAEFSSQHREFERIAAIAVVFRSNLTETIPTERPRVVDTVTRQAAISAETLKPGKADSATSSATGLVALPKPPKPDIPPVLKGKFELAFPEDPLLAILGGEAAFVISIDDIGRVVAIAAERSTLPAPLQAAAEQALQRARFIPGMRDGYYVPSEMRWHVTISPEVGLELQAVGKPVISPKGE